MPEERKDGWVHVRVEPTLRQTIRLLAKAEQVSVSELIRRTLVREAQRAAGIRR